VTVDVTSVLLDSMSQPVLLEVAIVWNAATTAMNVVLHQHVLCVTQDSTLSHLNAMPASTTVLAAQMEPPVMNAIQENTGMELHVLIVLTTV